MMKNICFQYGTEIGRWRKGPTVMLLMIYRVVITEKLRDILLFEANFNFSNKLYFGNRLMKVAESSGVLPQKQHGGISGHTSIKVALLRSLLFDYARETINNAEIGSYDADFFNDRGSHIFFHSLIRLLILY